MWDHVTLRATDLGVDAGYRDDGEPGPRPEYGPDYYGGFLLDPDGNSAEAVHHDLVADRDLIDHLWIRVADVAAAKAFYATIAPHTGAGRAAGVPRRLLRAFVLDPDGNNIETVFHDRR